MTVSQSTLITASDRIYVAGHRGMAGSAIGRALHRF
jgi:nucleoside-diphosphate-sugar epimerase